MRQKFWRLRRGIARARQADADAERAFLWRLALYLACLLSPWPALGFLGAVAAVAVALAGAGLWLWWSAPRGTRNAHPLTFALTLLLVASTGAVAYVAVQIG